MPPKTTQTTSKKKNKIKKKKKDFPKRDVPVSVSLIYMYLHNGMSKVSEHGSSSDEKTLPLGKVPIQYSNVPISPLFGTTLNLPSTPNTS